jgi:hypothetical protein
MDVQSRGDGCGLYEFTRFMLDAPERRCLRMGSPGQLTTSGGTA